MAYSDMDGDGEEERKMEEGRTTAEQEEGGRERKREEAGSQIQKLLFFDR